MRVNGQVGDGCFLLGLERRSAPRSHSPTAASVGRRVERSAKDAAATRSTTESASEIV
jgi:hypothetical protein